MLVKVRKEIIKQCLNITTDIETKLVKMKIYHGVNYLSGVTKVR